MPLGIVAALPAEAKCLAGWPDAYQVLDISLPPPSKQTQKPLLSISGIGPEAAKAAASNLVNHGATGLLSWGCASALSERLEPGDLLLPEIVLAEEGQLFHTHEIWRKRLTEQVTDTLKWHEDMLVESSKMIFGVEEKQGLANTSDAIAVDMESASIGRVASQASIPFMVIRAVADTVDEGLPSCIAKAMDHKGRLQIQRLLPTLFRQPVLWPQLIRLGRHFHAATRILKIVSEQSGPLFHIA